jgi:hypothetical protein
MSQNPEKPEKSTTRLHVLPPMEPIPQPDDELDISRFTATDPYEPGMSGVRTMLQKLDVLKLSDARDWVLVRDDPAYMTAPLMFISVPVQGLKQKAVHLIDRGVAMRNCDDREIEQCRLVLAARPYDNFFLAKVPCTNLDNSWNESMLLAVEYAKTTWCKVLSQRAQGYDRYVTKDCRDRGRVPPPGPYGVPNWPTATMGQILRVSFPDPILDDNHPALLRLVGGKIEVGK